MQFCWTTINVKDMAASIEFYQDLVGLPVLRRMKPGHDMEIAFLGDGETQLELIRDPRTPSPAYGKDISLGFVVSSLDALTASLNSKGIPVHSGPFQPNPSIRFLFVLDPDGLRIQFVENSPAH